MSGPALRIIGARFTQAQMAIHRQPHFCCVGVLLPIVLPPADWTKSHRFGSFKRLVSTAGTAEAVFDSALHGSIDDGTGWPVYREARILISSDQDLNLVVSATCSPSGPSDGSWYIGSRGQPGECSLVCRPKLMAPRAARLSASSCVRSTFGHAGSFTK